MRRRSLARAAALLAGGWTACASAGPPFLTGDPDTVDAGHWEMSVGWRTERSEGVRVDAAPAVEVNYGVADGLELSLEGAWLRASEGGGPKVRGTDNPIVGLKWRVLEQEKDGVSFAIKPEWEFRNSSSARKGLAEGHDTGLVDFRVQKGFGHTLLGAAVARTFPSKGSGAWEYGVSLRQETESGHTFGIELNGAAAHGSEPAELIVNAGAQIKVSEWGKLLLGIGRGLRGEEPKLDLRGYVGWQLAF